MIQFDVMTTKQKAVIKTIFDILKDFEKKYEKEQIIREIEEKGYPATLVGEFMTRAMNGDLAKYKDIFLSTEKKGIPVRLEGVRFILMAYVDERAGQMNIPEFLRIFIHLGVEFICRRFPENTADIFQRA